jgi:hypothetical protein
MNENRIYALILMIFFVCGAVFLCVPMVPGQDIKRPILEKNKVYRIEMPANRHWVSTGYDVEKGQTLYFRAEGIISLQKGNPKAFPCSPKGLDLKTMQQPITDENLGALIGRVVLLISVEEDEETGEEIRNEIIKEFYIGESGEVVMPIQGELQLGINELVVEDNEGNFRVFMRLIED